MPSPFKLLVFQHIDIEHPGIFRDFLAEDGIEWDAVELDANETIPDLSGYDGVWVMGGPMDVWEEDAHPWLIPEKQAIREAVEDRGMPYLGVCLGHQLLADALGGEVGPGEPEVGILNIALTAAGQRCEFFQGVPREVTCLQWHGAEVKRVPEHATVLASTPACQVQAMQVGTKAVSVQYHVELTEHTIGEWSKVPAYQAALESTLGADAIDDFIAAGNANMATFNRDSRTLYNNFKKIAGISP